ncbi:MAG: hypothetical protein ACRD16_06035 [Thermoanaerobaculia bacterium]
MGRPDLSVVVPVSTGCSRAADAVAALLASTSEVAGEILLADSSTDGSALEAPASPRIRRLPLAAGCNAAALRAAGILEAAGAVVALVEPWAIAQPGWGRSLLEGHARAGGDAVVGGPVLYGGTGGSASLAEFYFEYGAFLPPLTPEVTELPVNNVSYSSALLERFRSDWSRGFWKHFLHRRMRASGTKFFASPGALVRHVREVPFLQFCRERLDHGRAYAGLRESSRWRVLLAPVLPFLLTGRIARAVWSRPGARRPLVEALPLLLAAEGAWAVGEALGCAAGGGDSASRVF